MSSVKSKHLPAFGTRSPLKIGLLGGSFNPAHIGHIHISKIALKKLGLDQVWWLVSPQNPHKTSDQMAGLDKRYGYAQKILDGEKNIIACTLETELCTQFTADSLKEIQKRYPCFEFVWLMGADNLLSFHKWQNWVWIAENFPIAIFHRPGYSRRSLASQSAHRFNKRRIAQSKAFKLTKKCPPGWVFFAIHGNNISATLLRERSKEWLNSTL